MDAATSPGRIWVPAKIRIDMANRRRMPSAMRWATSFSNGTIRSCLSSRREPALGQRVAVHQLLVRIERPALDARSGGVDELVEHRQDQAAFVADDHRHVAVHLLALG